MDWLLTIFAGTAGVLVYVLTLLALVGVVLIARWAINHGVDSIAALFGRGPKAKR